MSIDTAHDALLLETYTPELLAKLGVTFHDAAGIPAPDDGSARRVDDALSELVANALAMNFAKAAATGIAGGMIAVSAVAREAIALRGLVDDAIVANDTRSRDGWQVQITCAGELVAEVEIYRSVRTLSERFS